MMRKLIAHGRSEAIGDAFEPNAIQSASITLYTPKGMQFYSAEQTYLCAVLA